MLPSEKTAGLKRMGLGQLSVGISRRSSSIAAKSAGDNLGSMTTGAERAVLSWRFAPLGSAVWDGRSAPDPVSATSAPISGSGLLHSTAISVQVSNVDAIVGPSIFAALRFDH